MRFCSSLERDARISELFFDGLVLEKKEFLNLLPHKSQKSKRRRRRRRRRIYIRTNAVTHAHTHDHMPVKR